jgi:hypothetical protein
MPKLTCFCGENIDLSRIPNAQGFKILWEPRIEILIDAIVTLHRQCKSDEEFERNVYYLIVNKPDILQAYECPKCGQLAVFARASDTDPALWLRRERVGEDELDSLVSLAQQVVDERK